MSKDLTSKPHAVCIPNPYQSHIKYMLKLAKQLYHKGFHITFVNTELNHRRLLKARGPDSLRGLPDFRFETIPDGLPPSDSDDPRDIHELGRSILRNWLAPFTDLIHKLNNTFSSSPGPVTCIVADGFLPFTVQAAKQLDIPVALFFTISACGFMGFQQINTLKEKGLIPLKGESLLTKDYLDIVVDWIPGMKDVRLRDVLFGITDPNDFSFEYMMEATAAASDASAIILHTFDALEQPVLDAISSMFRPVFTTIGPLQFLLNRVEGDELRSIGYNLWKEESECLQWLDTKKPNSVVYVNFGSIAIMTKQQLIELGMGLVKSGHPFLWIIRPDMVSGDNAVLPPEFMEEAGEKGYIASWCPQEEVLNHPSIGGFLTHCGWNSTIESISSGVPLLCWPFLFDQPMNCRYSCGEWGIGMEIDDHVDRNEVGKLVRELMQGERGKKMKNRTMDWKKLAQEATGPDGSSSINLDRLVNEVLLSHQTK